MLKICVFGDGIIRGGVGWRFSEYWYCTLLAIVIRVIVTSTVQVEKEEK